MHWVGLHDRVRDLLASARTSVLLVAPFAKEAQVAELLDAVADGVRIDLFTRWRVEDVASRVTDTGVLLPVRERGGSVWLVDDLHAKLVAADLSRALAGSANLTAAGMGTSMRPNLELMVEVHEVAFIAPFTLELRRRARPATTDEAVRIEAAAAEVRARLSAPSPPDAAPVEVVVPTPWFPQFRSPDRLYRLYADPEWLTAAKPGDPALVDLANLRLPGGLNEPSFDRMVREVLTSAPVVGSIDALLETPQRFGAVAGVVGAYRPAANHRERQRATQVLIRWLLHFASDRYGLRTPGYSEILFRH